MLVLENIFLIWQKKKQELIPANCGEPDLNRHSSRHQHLKLACLPIPPSPHIAKSNKIILAEILFRCQYLLFCSM